MRGIVLTDIHVDPLYNPTASPANGCLCREECSNTSQLWTGHFSRPFGQRGCGAPPDLLDHILASAAREVPSPDFVFLLGDLLAQSSTLDARHRASTANYSLIMREYYPTVTSRIAKAFPSAVKSSHGLGCAVALGNNDVHPDYEIGLNVSSFYMWQAAAIADLCGLSELEATSFRRGGFYARSGAPGGPRLAVLNTAPYSSLHGPPLNVTSHPDPFGQFVWLEAELTRAAAQRTPLLILGHMPPVLDFYDRAPLWQEAYAARYWELMKRHSSAVAGQFFGHSHMTQFRVWGGVPAEAQAPLLVMGSVSPKYGNNPSFAVVTLGQGGGDEEEGGAVDLRPSEVRAYYADLASAKDAQTPRVELLYSTATRLQCCKQPNITSCCTPLSQSPPPRRRTADQRALRPVGGEHDGRPGAHGGERGGVVALPLRPERACRAGGAGPARHQPVVRRRGQLHRTRILWPWLSCVHARLPRRVALLASARRLLAQIHRVRRRGGGRRAAGGGASARDQGQGDARDRDAVHRQARPRQPRGQAQGRCGRGAVAPRADGRQGARGGPQAGADLLRKERDAHGARHAARVRTYRRVASRTGVAGRRIAEGYGGRAPPVHGAQPRSP